IDNQEYSFTPGKGKKYVVLDFWGSWCAPCIAGFPKMKEIYANYKDKLEIIGIACNDTEAKWRKAIDKHDLKWVNLLNQDNDINKDVSVMYAVEVFPTKIIISPDGKIYNIFNGEGDDFYDSLNDLLKNL
ncbi:TlpA family protein disulfide reductase, partial [Fulvivirga sp. RKSG066]|uniref:TlpA family protein disulfide reductase n=1 Tax=Fulvivirga aurantia TaxID=2529383 RepID=UPI0012BB87D2